MPNTILAASKTGSWTLNPEPKKPGLILKFGPEPWAWALKNLSQEKPGLWKTWTLKNLPLEKYRPWKIDPEKLGINMELKNKSDFREFIL